MPVIFHILFNALRHRVGLPHAVPSTRDHRPLLSVAGGGNGRELAEGGGQKMTYGGKVDCSHRV